MAVGTLFSSFYEKQAEAVFNLGSDTLKIMLSNVAPAAGNALKADITEIASGNGYTAGGSAITVTASSQTAGVYTLVCDDLVFTASGGAIANFRYAVLYDDTAASDPLIGWWDAGSTISLADTQTFTFVFGAYLLRFQAA
jgi:hypothetical protein